MAVRLHSPLPLPGPVLFQFHLWQVHLLRFNFLGLVLYFVCLHVCVVVLCTQLAYGRRVYPAAGNGLSNPLRNVPVEDAYLIYCMFLLGYESQGSYMY